MNASSTGQVSARAGLFPWTLRFGDVRLYLFAGVFILLDVAVPWALHRLHPLAGPTFLPMFFFTLLAGLLFGWRAGLLVGLLAPLVSYAASGMPVLWRLPHTAAQNGVLGLSVGLFRERCGLGLMSSLAAAIAAGYLALALSAAAMQPPGVEPAAWIWQTVQRGWPGTAVQLALLPLIVRQLDDRLSRTRYRDR